MLLGQSQQTLLIIREKTKSLISRYSLLRSGLSRVSYDDVYVGYTNT